MTKEITFSDLENLVKEAVIKMKKAGLQGKLLRESVENNAPEEVQAEAQRIFDGLSWGDFDIEETDNFDNEGAEFGLFYEENGFQFYGSAFGYYLGGGPEIEDVYGVMYKKEPEGYTGCVYG